VERIRLNQDRFQETVRTKRTPEALPAGPPPSSIRPEPRLEARPPLTGTSENVRKRDLPDTFRTPPPAAPRGTEGQPPEIKFRTGPGSQPESERVAPPRQVKEREIRKDGPDHFRMAPPPLRSYEDRERPAPGMIRREMPEIKKEPPALREVPRERVREVERPAPRGKSKTPPADLVTGEKPGREPPATAERRKGTGPGTKPPGKSSPKGKDKPGKNEGGPKER
jgi:hypothetical protein